MIVALLRHGRTAWNDAGRMQGRADEPLSEAGRAQVLSWRLPASLLSARVVCSPLRRARETAELLGRGPVTLAPALVEMDWGAWEGARLDELRTREGPAFERASARGVDFRPPGGESPRDVAARVVAWLKRLEAGEGPLIAVTHQGVIRACMARITVWSMVGKPPVRLADNVVHLVAFANGTLIEQSWNVPLVAGPLLRRSALRDQLL